MTKAEAVQSMHEGYKVQHKYFGQDEYIYMKDGEIHCEKGYNIDSEFWILRTEKHWESDWELYTN